VVGRAAGAALLTILALRYAIGGLGLFAIGGGPRRARVTRRQLLALLFLGGGGQTAVTVISLSSLDYIPAATLGFLFYTFPAWVTIFAALRRTEPLTPIRIAALLLSLGGILLMVGNPFASTLSPIGVGLALASAVIYALYIPLLNWLQRGLDPAIASAWLAVGATAILTSMALATGQLSLDFGPRAWVAILILAFGCTTLAFSLFLRGLAVLGPVRSAIVSTVEPFWTAILGAVVLAQPLTPNVIGGGALIATAVGLLQRKKQGPGTGD
jgi:drug/metabolite transporter (DMT)-like permease